MKKLLIMFLLIKITASAFCKEADGLNEKQSPNDETYLENVLAINIGYLTQAFKNGRTGFGLGAMYEHSLSDYFSILIEGGGIGYTQKDAIKHLQLDITGYSRFYPQGNALAKLFVGAGVGYSFVEIKYNNDVANSHLWRIIPEIGYKFVLTYVVFEFGLGYRFKFGEKNYPKEVVGASIENDIHYRILGGFIIR
jgi:hypothetical protein